ncbi:MAG: hypothetical protein IJ057_12870, partial [Bacteroidales bacterium]|nr:hypothetical protein [Bacteroidales bacterium]
SFEAKTRPWGGGSLKDCLPKNTPPKGLSPIIVSTNTKKKRATFLVALYRKGDLKSPIQLRRIANPAKRRRKKFVIQTFKQLIIND